MDTEHFTRALRGVGLAAGQQPCLAGAALFMRRDLSEQALRAPAEPQFDQSQMADARRQGFDAGRSAGLAESDASLLAQQSRALAKIAASMADADAQATRVADGAAAALASALLAALNTAMPDLIRRSALSEAGAMLAQVMPGLSRQPHVDVQVPPEISQAISALLVPSGGGRVAVRAAPSMQPGGVLVSWSTGEAERRPDDLWRGVMELMEPLLEQPGLESPAHV